MRRNQKKTTFIAALCLLAALASACQKQPEGEEVIDSIEARSEEPSQEVTFQDQYDLGMRLLSEGSYEEAIIAFTAALAIDPKSVDVYTALADTYEAMGDMGALHRILEQGIEATGDAGLQERLANLPVQMPQLPEIWEGVSTYYSEITYVPVDEELESIVAEAIEAGLAGDREFLEDAAWNAQWAERICTYLKESGIEQMNRVYESDEVTEYKFWTQLSDGSILRYRYTDRTSYVWFTIVYRTEEGNGFYSELWVYPEGNIRYSLMQGEISGWLFNGSYEQILYQSGSDDAGNPYENTVQITGTAVDDLVDGERVSVCHWNRKGEESSWTEYEEFKAGKLQVIWTDEFGMEYTRMDVYETGEAGYGNSGIITAYPWGEEW